MKPVLGTPVSEYLPAFALLILTVIYLATAYAYAPAARTVPAGVAWVMIALLILDLVSRTRTPLGATLMRWLNPAGDASKSHGGARYSALRQLGAVAWILSFVAAMVLIGILYAVPLYVFLSLLVRGRRALWVAAVVAAGGGTMIWGLFDLVLQLELYPGVLFGGV